MMARSFLLRQRMDSGTSVRKDSNTRVSSIVQSSTDAGPRELDFPIPMHVITHEQTDTQSD